MKSHLNKKKIINYLQEKLKSDAEVDSEDVDEKLVEKIEKYEQTQRQTVEEEKKYKDFNEDIEQKVAAEQTNSLMIKEMLMKEKRDIEYADEHNRLMYARI